MNLCDPCVLCGEMAWVKTVADLIEVRVLAHLPLAAHLDEEHL